MSHNASPPSRPPSSSSISSSSVAGAASSAILARVHGHTGHDHNRPLPPPRLPDTTGTLVPLTAPLTPLSTSSFRSSSSRPPVQATQQNGQPGTTIAAITTASPTVAITAITATTTATITTSTTTSTTSTTIINASQNQRSANNEPPRSPVGEVTLTVPRPDGERAVNEYVDTPFRPTVAQSLALQGQKCPKNERRHHQKTTAHHHHHNHHHHHHHQQQQQQHQQQQQQQQQHENHLQSSSPANTVTKQPVSFTKEPANSISSGSLGPRTTAEGISIICDFCGRCRCESCREPPPLPSRWLCDNSCFCSAETALDYASCLCCVKGLFYHCADSGSGVDAEGGGSCADEPCSCTGTRKTARWACLGALTFVLPCLLCYWPFKGCVALCEACYARHASQGCRCDPSTLGRHLGSAVMRDSRDPEKRLLDPVTPEL